MGLGAAGSMDDEDPGWQFGRDLCQVIVAGGFATCSLGAACMLHVLPAAPQLHFDVKPANMCVLPCPAGGPPHITLLDMGAATHIAALRAPQRSTLYPVVSMDHMDVALLTMQPGQVRRIVVAWATQQG